MSAGLGYIPFGIGIDEFNSALIPELELEDLEQKELELELHEKELGIDLILFFCHMRLMSY